MFVPTITGTWPENLVVGTTKIGTYSGSCSIWGTQTSASKYPIYGIDEPLAPVTFNLKSDMLLSSSLVSIELKQVSLMVVMSDPVSMSAEIDWPSIITVDSFVQPIILSMRGFFSLEQWDVCTVSSVCSAMRTLSSFPD